ncbi:MAG: YfcE family phosphodiesterase [Candidatus Omnitrophica bacterium]|nr:YfcE family phosphodiesterase [Candidatus Omnitrophota bacterium]
MLVGVISDTHDAILETRNAIHLFKQEKVGAIIHAGDFTSADLLREYLKIRIPFFGVFGNQDSKNDLLEVAQGVVKEPPFYLVLDNRSLLIVHDEKKISLDKESEIVDVIICGNTHEPRIEKKNRALIVNPGEGSGLMNGKPTVALLDLEKLEAKIIELKDVYT